jgi:restriction system protein
VNADVFTAIEMLLEQMNNAKTQLADALREATLNGRFDEAQWLLAKTKRVEHLVQQVHHLREAWERLDDLTRLPAVEVNSEISEGETASDEGDAPELTVVSQLFGPSRRRKRRKRQAVNKTPNHAYRLPILETLEQLGGRGRAQEVVSIVYVKMKDRLTEDDLKPLPSGRSVRWENTVRWERQNMVNEELLRDDSPVGVWEMTEAGRAYLQQARQQTEWKDGS